MSRALRMRFMCANRISTFLRSRRDCSKASVLAKAQTITHIFVKIAGNFAHRCGRALRLFFRATWANT